MVDSRRKPLKKYLKLLKKMRFRDFLNRFFVDFVEKKSEVDIYDRIFKPPGKSVAGDCEVYLSVCAIIKNEGPYLKEWIEFHRLVGVERFYLYDNESDDETAEVLRPYIEKGIVQLIPWPRFVGYSAPQFMAFAHCMRLTFGKTFWLVLIDADEFLFTPKGKALNSILGGLEESAAIVVNSYTFGDCGHSSKPPGLVIENYLKRYPTAVMDNYEFKSIVQPGTVLRISNPHWFHLQPHAKVNGKICKTGTGRKRWPFCISNELLRINHYHTKSTEEFAAKLVRGSVAQLAFRPRERIEKKRRRIQNREVLVEDTSILQFLPELKKAMSE